MAREMCEWDFRPPNPTFEELTNSVINWVRLTTTSVVEHEQTHQLLPTIAIRISDLNLTRAEIVFCDLEEIINKITPDSKVEEAIISHLLNLVGTGEENIFEHEMAHIAKANESGVDCRTAFTDISSRVGFRNLSMGIICIFPDATPLQRAQIASAPKRLSSGDIKSFLVNIKRCPQNDQLNQVIIKFTEKTGIKVE